MVNQALLARTVLVIAVPAVAASLLVGTFPSTLVSAATTSQASSIRASFELSGTGHFTTAPAVTVVDESLEGIGSGERELLASKGKAPDSTSRARLTLALRRAATATIAAVQQLAARQRVANAVKQSPAITVIYAIASPLLGKAHPAAAPRLPRAMRSLAAAQKATSDDVRAWHLQNTIRVNREKALAAAAAAAAAAQRAAASHPTTVQNSGVYRENVWASGFQTQLDACRGGVNLSAAYGVATIGEVWGCGGSRFPRTGGEVQLTGIMGGLYRVGPVIAILNAHTDSPSEIPRGYALLYQTCLNGNASTETFTELTPIG